MGLCEVLRHRRDSEFVKGVRLRCTARVVNVFAMDESWCDESLYGCLGEVR
jgi:hypothetical protein